MLCGAPYDRRTRVVYVFTCTVIWKLKSFMVNNVLFYNNVHDFGTPQSMLNIGRN